MIRSFTFSRSKWSSSRISRARSRSRSSVVCSVHGSEMIQSRYVRMTPYSAAAGGSFSSRASSRVAAFSACSGNFFSSIRPRSSLISACCSSPSPSSSWIAFSCCRRKNSRWPLSISLATWDWIFEPSSDISTSRFRISDTARSRSSTLTVSSSSWRSSVLRRSVEAIRWQSALGSSTFAAASCSSSGRYGVIPMMCANCDWTLRVSASTSGDSGSTSGSSSSSAIRYGSSCAGSTMRTRWSPCTRIRSVPSGTLIILWTIATVPTR